MVNTLQNSPEKISSKWGNKFKKAIALAIALTLSGEPAEAKTYEKQEFPTEMVSNIPWEYAPMTEAVEQATIPNYINQAENWVKKYYPQYEEYFEPILISIKTIWKETEFLINKKIQENLDIFSDDIKSEKDKITIILIAFEQFTWENSFSKFKDVEVIDKNEWYDIRAWIASEITFDINAQITKKLNESRIKVNKAIERSNMLKEEIKKYENKEINKTPNWIINDIEELFEIIEVNRLKDLPTIQKITQSYKNICKRIDRLPSKKWELFIKEYEKIQNKN